MRKRGESVATHISDLSTAERELEPSGAEGAGGRGRRGELGELSRGRSWEPNLT